MEVSGQVVHNIYWPIGSYSVVVNGSVLKCHVASCQIVVCHAEMQNVFRVLEKRCCSVSQFKYWCYIILVLVIGEKTVGALLPQTLHGQEAAGRSCPWC